MTHSLHNPDGVHPPVGRYSHLARVTSGELLFLAGQVSVDADGMLVGKDDAAAQTLQAYRNIGTVLKSAGASFASIVQLTTYVVGRESVQPYLDARTELFADIFPDDSYPPNTLLVISGLVDPDMLVEVTAVAGLPVGAILCDCPGDRELTCRLKMY